MFNVLSEKYRETISTFEQRKRDARLNSHMKNHTEIYDKFLENAQAFLDEIKYVSDKETYDEIKRTLLDCMVDRFEYRKFKFMEVFNAYAPWSIYQIHVLSIWEKKIEYVPTEEDSLWIREWVFDDIDELKEPKRLIKRFMEL